MQTDLDEKLAAAFHAWSEAREKLDEMRRSPEARQRQFAASPELVKFWREMTAQEEVCRARFEELAELGEQRQRALDARLVERLRARGIEPE